jgi:hypothetical protein
MISARPALHRSRPLHHFLRPALYGLALGLAVVAGAGCADPACERDTDCPPDYLCATNRSQNRCVPDPYADITRDGGGGDAGIDAGIDASVLPSTCDSDTDTFDPGAVYLLGSVPGAGCSPNAVAALASPDVESVGFGCGVDAGSAAIRPSDGRLVYVDSEGGRVLVFSKDAHAYDPSAAACTYPADPGSNDQVIATDACSGSIGTPSEFLFAPDLEGVWYTCTNASGLWFDENHDRVDAVGTRAPLLRGYGGSMLVGPSTGELSSPRELVLVVNGNETAVGSGLSEEGSVLAMRALDDGFWIALQNDGEAAIQRLLVGLDGSVAVDGVYPALPASVTLDAAGAGHALDASGALYASVVDGRQASPSAGVARLVLGGAATVVYTEASAPEVTTAGAALVTVR